MIEQIWNYGTKLSGYDTDKPFWTGCQIKCPECEYWSAEGEWKEGEVHCDDCGSHDSIMCPNCNEWFDGVYSGNGVFYIR